MTQPVIAQSYTYSSVSLSYEGKTMKTLIIEIDDDAYQQVFNFMKLVPKCHVLNLFDDLDDKETHGILAKLKNYCFIFKI